jgi:hypothetical protein
LNNHSTWHIFGDNPKYLLILGPGLTMASKSNKGAKNKKQNEGGNFKQTAKGKKALL